MSPAWTRTFAILVFIAARTPALAGDSPSLAGIWTFQKTKFIATATTYTHLREDGSCSQASKVSVVGTTHWLTVRCTWSIEGTQLVMRIVAASDKDLVGTSTSVRIDSISDASFVYEKDGKLETWVRDKNLPADYAERMFHRGADPQRAVP